MGSKLDTRAVGLDVGLSFIRWLTGAENLHYGLWTGLEVTAGNLRAAQEAYTQKLFGLLPQGRPLSILDVGGGAGETAKKLTALGHQVDIVVPSPFLADRCRANAPEAAVHECMFEDYSGDKRFDVCLFSESFQYIPLRTALGRAAELLAPGGAIVIADCFRTDAYTGGRRTLGPKPGGGHMLSDFRALLQEMGLRPDHDEDISEAVAPSIDLEQGLFHVFGHAMTRIDGELSEKKPRLRWTLMRALRLVVSERRRKALSARLVGNDRTAAEFLIYNRYQMLRLYPGEKE